MTNKIIEIFWLWQYEQIEFKKNVLKFRNKKTKRVYTCDSKNLLRENWDDVVWEFNKLDKRLVVWHYLKKKILDKRKKEKEKLDK